MRAKIKPLDPESYEKLAALFRPLGERACPLYRRTGRRAYEVIGTGVPVRGQRYAALLTASHVLDELEDGHAVIAGSKSLLRFPAVTARFSHSRPLPVVDVDVAAIALPAAALRELQQFYKFTTAAELGEFEEYGKLTFYGFVGCPHTKNRDEPGSTQGTVKPYFYVTREYGALPAKSSKLPTVHKALLAPLRTASGPEGRIVSAPDPHGISGCGVWKIKLDPVTGVASPPLLAGIGIEYHPHEGVFVATNAGIAAVVIAELWQQLDEGRGRSTTLELREGDP